MHLLRVSPALHPSKRPSHTHTPKPSFEERGHEIYIVVVVDSHIQRIVLTNEETTVTQQVSHRHLSDANPTSGHKEVRRSAGYIMATTRYSDQQGYANRVLRGLQENIKIKEQ